MSLASDVLDTLRAAPTALKNADIRDALGLEGSAATTSISATLADLIERGAVSRELEDGKYYYHAVPGWQPAPRGGGVPAVEPAEPAASTSPTQAELAEAHGFVGQGPAPTAPAVPPAPACRTRAARRERAAAAPRAPEITEKERARLRAMVRTEPRPPAVELDARARIAARLMAYARVAQPSAAPEDLADLAVRDAEALLRRLGAE